jgi:membrane protein YdbS with pleckstrin-like domain/predicted nucleic acid-binding Zn ribbon protein
MEAVCPHCNNKYNVDPQYIGQQIKCQTCGNNFEVVNGNLSPCPDCFSLISKRAAVCPKCGAPLKKQTGIYVSQTFSQDGTVRDDISTERKIKVYNPSMMNYLWTIIFGIITIPAVVGLFILLYVLIEIMCTSYELTTHRIIVRRGWISKSQNEIWIKDMRGVNLVQGIWQRIIGVGNIAIGTAASAGAEISIVGIANPSEVIAEINSLRK